MNLTGLGVVETLRAGGRTALQDATGGKGGH